MTYTRYFCRTYIADGIHVSQTIPCETAEEAISKAAAWKANGHKTEAVKVDVDLDTYEVTKTLL